MRKATLKRAAATLTIVAAVGSASPAFAIATHTDGVHAKTFSSDKRIQVKDTKPDGHKVKANYYRKATNTDKRVLWNNKGFNKVTKSGSGSKIFKIQACKEINNGPDKCSKWKS